MRTTSDAGQASTEYMLTISVVVIAIVAAAYAFVPAFRSGVQDLALDVQSVLDNGTVGGTGLARNGGGQTPGNGSTGGRNVADTGTATFTGNATTGNMVIDDPGGLGAPVAPASN